MNSALRYLLWKTTFGRVRMIRRRFQGPKGLLTFIAILLISSTCIGPQVAANFIKLPDPERITFVTEKVRFYTPPIILFLFLLSTTRGGLYFRPAEIQYLFPAPIHRRQILLYNVASKLRVQILSGLWFTLCFARYAHSYLAGFLGVCLTLAFLQVTLQLTALFSAQCSDRWRKRARLLFLIGLVAFILRSFIGPDQGGGIRWQTLPEIIELPVIQTLCWFPRPFVEIFCAPTNSAALLWSALGVAIIALEIGLMMALDLAYQDGALKQSDKVRASMERSRRAGNMLSGSTQPRAGWHLPPFPFLGGAGPLARRQCQEMVRNVEAVLRFILFASILLAPFMVLAAGSNNPKEIKFLYSIVLIVLYTALYTTQLSFDFRRDLDRLAYFKGLPIGNLQVAVGQTMATALFLTVLQSIAIGAMTLFYWPIPPRFLLTIALALPFVNWVMISVENAIFLWFPYRTVTSDPGQMPFVGRTLLVVVLKSLAIILIIIAAIALGALGTHFGGKSLLVGMAMVIVTFFLASFPVTWLTAKAYGHFDVSRDLP